MTPQEFLAEYVRIGSLSGEEHEAAEFISQFLVDHGLEVIRKGNNVWAEIGSGSPRLLVNSHMDTVPRCAGWTCDPLAGEWNDGKLTALGANDAKGCGTAILFATQQVKMPSVGTLVVAITAEEESGGAGGFASALPEFGDLDAAIIGEPTQLRVCTAQRGMLILRMTASGISGHVAHGSKADNAIYSAARDLAALELLEFEPHDLLGQTQAQVTMIEGGITRNQIPDRCEFWVDFRTTPNLDHDAMVEEIRQRVRSEIIVHSERYQPRFTASNEPIVRSGLQASNHKQEIGSATVSDWSHLSGVPAIKVGPGDTLRSHKPDEYLLESELLEGIRFYKDCVEAYFEEAARG
ncbi:MAG: M20/M25/M40 family metallo-hydrolase [Armatimonadetes bacterium]|nr:M20/M25/M40 family metallo-hydrolase [Armatimonadota bacterium]